MYAWADSDTRIPYRTTDVVDTAGDAIIAAPTSVLYRGGSPEQAARVASAAAATVRCLPPADRDRPVAETQRVDH